MLEKQEEFSYNRDYETYTNPKEHYISKTAFTAPFTALFSQNLNQFLDHFLSQLFLFNGPIQNLLYNNKMGQSNTLMLDIFIKTYIKLNADVNSLFSTERFSFKHLLTP